jgi:type IV pilus assembly protein PilW
MKTTSGFSLVEVMVSVTLGIILSIAIIAVYIAQKNIYRTNVSQASIQSAENAISELITPTIRSTGFCGCSTILQALSNLHTGGPPPLGTLGSTPSMVMGYAFTANPIVITQDYAGNSTNANNWSPGLDASLIGSVGTTSDVLIVLGAVPESAPVGVTTFTSGSSSLILQSSTGITSGQFGAISDCLKASVFTITSVSGNTITHDVGSGALANSSGALLVDYPVGAQFVALLQTAFFVANTPNGQSSLVRATLNTSGTWSIQSIIPGVQVMKVLYGVGSNGLPTQYVSANAVTNWGQIYSIRLGFLIQGQQGSATLSPTSYTVLGTTVNVPNDNRLRHVYEMTINLRNSEI